MDEITTEDLEQAAMFAAIEATEEDNPLKAIDCLAHSQIYSLMAQAYERGESVGYVNSNLIPNPRHYIRGY